MKYIVYPNGARSGNLRSVCKSEIAALREKKKMEVLTGKEWLIAAEP